MYRNKIIRGLEPGPDWLLQENGEEKEKEEEEEESDTNTENHKHLYGLLSRGGKSVLYLVYSALLIAEFCLWIQAKPDFMTVGLCVLPVILLPSLYTLFSLTRKRLYMGTATLLLLPPSPLGIITVLVYRSFRGDNTYRWSIKSRMAGLLQSCLMSFPLIVLSFSDFVETVFRAPTIDTENITSCLVERRLELYAVVVSLINLIIAATRFNERLTGAPVKYLVGIPFLISNILFRIVGFGLLFSLFDVEWKLMCVGILVCIGVLSVLLATPCTRCSMRSMRAASLSLPGVLMPLGYTGDKTLGHSSTGWKLIFINVVGSLTIFSIVIHTVITEFLPQSLTVYPRLDMVRPLAAMELIFKIQGRELSLEMPEFEVQLQSDEPAKLMVTLSKHELRLLSVIVPGLLVLTILPFTVLRILLIGWKCGLQKNESHHEYNLNLNTNRAMDVGRACCTVVCSLFGLFSSLIFIMIMTTASLSVIAAS